MPSAGCCSGSKRRDFEISEPCRHHQVIGGEFQPHLARRLDEGEVLIGKRQNGNLREIDLLLARKRQQQVERAFKALDVDHERRLVGGALGKLRFELILGSHAEPDADCPEPAISLANSARLSATSIGAAGLAQRQRGRGPARSVPRELGRRGGHRQHFGHLAIAVEHHIATRCDRCPCALAKRARQRAHRNIVAHQEPRKADRITNHVAHYSGRSGGRRDRIDGGKHNMCGHAERQRA